MEILIPQRAHVRHLFWHVFDAVDAGKEAWECREGKSLSCGMQHKLSGLRGGILNEAYIVIA
ncbi:MAG: hypothetical protein B7Z37_17705 [Verrucomicrobia bacterium 12-59-8]|nr:MAG: hypothetical protein B7Z37_17705 [Verrucomicrobia bacterium 12-59-8]